MDRTLYYYNTNAREYVNGTLHVDMTEIQNLFLGKITPMGKILDFGCGSGRDALAFIEKGYSVDAIDGSPELCRLASEILPVPVRKMYFHELKAVDRYDGIWACASLLHLDAIEMKEVMFKMIKALKVNGVIYASFKFGDFIGVKGDRYYHNYTEESFRTFLEGFDSIGIEMSWMTTDVREGCESEKWLNVILRKTGL